MSTVTLGYYAEEQVQSVLPRPIRIVIRSRTGIAVSGVLVVVIAVASAFWLVRSPSPSPSAGGAAVSPGGANRAGVLPSFAGAGAATQGAIRAEPPEPIGPRVDGLMRDWRTAIVNRNAERVQSLDQTFASYPGEFVPALMASAESDPDERVRSFSTRVLGKLKPPETKPLLRKLLADRSEYVRFNAAWALGELGDREAAKGLRRLQKHDPSPTVRRSAQASLSRMDGG